MKIDINVRLEVAREVLEIMETMMSTAPMPQSVLEFHSELCDALASHEARVREGVN
jgi:hypothetical protein